MTLKLLDAEGNVNHVRNEAAIIENNSYKLVFRADHYFDYTILYLYKTKKGNDLGEVSKPDISETFLNDFC